MEKISEGKTKEVFSLDNEHVLLRFKDSVTAGDGAKADVIEGKGVLNAQTSALLFRLLERDGIETHYVGMKDERTMIARRLTMIPVEVVLRNYATGSIVKRLPIKEGEVFNPPIVEFFLKDDARHDPLLNYHHMRHLKLMNEEEARQVEDIMVRVNDTLSRVISKMGLILYDFKLEFGRDGGKLVVGDEISLDSMRVREPNGRILDKDLYRKGYPLDQVKSSYVEFLDRLRSVI
ncbi:Phosphoribosylaminoimidazole-succinocarboxamide synthase [Metallosphaera sp. J1]|uniref:phosphoribosylaminoimidazolesuccinocarboxamide synthase n=1 Tax=Metallosphaera javensis (ex Hofmann et al. 2022) TaxID=99938 RepID=UPI001EE0DC03|nr:phosphoribosylaminoimidazolesuccinocarboxamide synthase [Metallosphaera javensis (ex Hofmann et al. 2022)]MCG3108642.1 Phosphoribosylaminoimidazole-succinocarboxamide synthase [Metallosphaera javensis (ex Hofmann et al. 2022)]